MKSKNAREQRQAGFLIFLGGLIILSGILTAQSLYPGYDAQTSAISDLGAPIEIAYHQSPAVLQIHQPSSIILIVSVLVFSIFIFQAGRMSRRLTQKRWFSRLVRLFGAGGLIIVVSYVPYYIYSNQVIQGTFSGDPLPLVAGALLHLVGAGLLFVAGGLSGIAAFTLFKNTFGHLSVLVGSLVVIVFILNLSGIYLGLGSGGSERVAAYPLFLWVMALGLSFYMRD